MVQKPVANKFYEGSRRQHSKTGCKCEKDFVPKPSPLFWQPSAQNFYFSINRQNITSLSLSMIRLPQNHRVASQCFGIFPLWMVACAGLQKQLLHTWRHEILPDSLKFYKINTNSQRSEYDTTHNYPESERYRLAFYELLHFHLENSCRSASAF